MDVKVLEPITSYVKIFKNVDEFNLFYSKNKAEIDSQTTQMLNKMYFIEGYRITKIKGELMLKKYDDTMKRYFSRKDEQDLRDKDIVRLDEEIAVLAASIERSKQEIAEIRDSVNRIIRFLNPNADDVAEN